MNDSPNKTAIVRGPSVSQEAIQAYMPVNYMAIAEGEDDQGPYVLITGVDVAGWTMVDYVRPRLASGLYSCTDLVPRITPDSAALDAIAAMMNSHEWDPDTPDEIARIVRSTGRHVGDQQQ